MKMVVPGYPKLKNKYEYLWDQKTPRSYLSIVAVMQKYVDQSISANTSYNPGSYPEGQIPMSVLITDMATAYKFGAKTLYYFQTNDGSFDAADETPEEEGELCIIDDQDCDACKL